MRKLEVGDFISVSCDHGGVEWTYLKASTQDLVTTILRNASEYGHIWQFGLHETLLPDNWQLVEKRTTSQMDWILRDRLDVDESLSESIEQAFVEALEAAHPFEGRA